MTNSHHLQQACTQLAALIADTRQAFAQHQQPNRRTAALLCDHMLSLHKLNLNAQKLLTSIVILPAQKNMEANVGDVAAGVLMADDEAIFCHAWQFMQVFTDEYLMDASIWLSRITASLKANPASTCAEQQIGESLLRLIKAFHRQHNQVSLMQTDEETMQWYTYATAQLPQAVVRLLHPEVAAQIA